MNRILTASLPALAAAALLAPAVQAAPLAITNSGFDAQTLTPGANGSTIITGWTQGPVGNFYVSAGGVPPLGGADPASGSQGTQNFVTASRGATAPVGPQTSTQSLFQNVSIATDAAGIDAGTSTLTLNFDYAASDTASGDSGSVVVSFTDGMGGSVGSPLSFAVTPVVAPMGATSAPYRPGLITGPVPINARNATITLNGKLGNAGTATNVAYDSFSGNIAVPEPASLGLLGLGGLALLRRRRA